LILWASLFRLNTTLSGFSDHQSHCAKTQRVLKGQGRALESATAFRDVVSAGDAVAPNTWALP